MLPHETILDFDQLNHEQLLGYRHCVSQAFPEIIQASKIATTFWPLVEQYFPTYQKIWFNQEGDLIGILNSLPFFWDQPLEALPAEGWDWLVRKGVADFRQKQVPNCLGGLQIILSEKYRGRGLSATLITLGKQLQKDTNLSLFIIPIRPTLKHRYPNMAMEEYIHYYENDRPYDPWLRTHLKCGAKIIGVCHKAMLIEGEVAFWQSFIPEEITKSGNYIPVGGLNPMQVDLEGDYGLYHEANVWIYYE